MPKENYDKSYLEFLETLEKEYPKDDVSIDELCDVILTYGKEHMLPRYVWEILFDKEFFCLNNFNNEGIEMDIDLKVEISHIAYYQFYFNETTLSYDRCNIPRKLLKRSESLDDRDVFLPHADLDNTLECYEKTSYMVRPHTSPPNGDDQHPTTTSSRARNNARARNTGNQNSTAIGSSRSCAGGSNNGGNSGDGGRNGRGGRRRDDAEESDAVKEPADGDQQEPVQQDEQVDGGHQEPVQQDEAMVIDPVNPLENLWELDTTVSDLPRTFSAAMVNGVLPGRPSTFPNFGLATLNFLTFPRHLGFTSRILSWQLHGDLMPACLVRVTLLPVIFLNNFHNKSAAPVLSHSVVREAHSAAYFPLSRLGNIFRFVSGTEGSVLCFLRNVARVILAELGDEAKATAIWLLLLHFAFAKLLTSRRQEGIGTSTLGFCAVVNMVMLLIKEYEDHAGISLSYYQWFFQELGLYDLDVVSGDVPSERLYPSLGAVMRKHGMEATYEAIRTSNDERSLVDMFEGHRFGLLHNGKSTEECFKRGYEDYVHAANVLDFLFNNIERVPDSTVETYKSFDTIRKTILDPMHANPNVRDGMTLLSNGVHPVERGLDDGLQFNTLPAKETDEDREIYTKAARKTYTRYEQNRMVPNPAHITADHIAAELGLIKRGDPVVVRPPHLLSRYAPSATAHDDDFLTDVDNLSPVRPSTPRTSPVSSIPRSEDDTEFDENAHENLANVRSERQELQNRVSELETQLREAQELARTLQNDLAEAQTRIGAAEGPSTSKRQKIVINDDLMPIKLEPLLMDEEVFSSSINKGSKPPVPKKSCRSQKRKISKKRKNNK